jgi:dolichol-phosphate mannosyltransferase
MSALPFSYKNVAVVLPCYKVKKQITDVIAGIGSEVNSIIVVDDACPEKSGAHVSDMINDSRITIITHDINQGVGGAVITGFKHAMANGADIVVKLDGDGQYSPSLIPLLISPISDGLADCSKGNRFFNVENLAEMPVVRIIGNAMLSFVNKLVSGYWNIMDPTNGLIAIHVNVLDQLPLDKLDRRYFFESDMLFRLSTVKAVIADIPLQAFYRDETSSLSITQVALSFPKKYINRVCKRIFYNYFLRDFNIGSINLMASLPLIISGAIYGMLKWYDSMTTGIPATAGMVMISGIQLLIGLNCLLSFFNYDVAQTPSRVQHKLLKKICN